MPGTRTVDFDCARDVVFEAAAKQAKTRRLPDPTEAFGLYVFGLSPRGKPTWPYYVGQAGKQTLYKRVFQKTDKRRVYNEILDEYVRAKPFVYLLPMLTGTGRLAGSNPTTQKVIDLAEQQLIGLALHANYGLWNIKHRVALEKFMIDGTARASRRETASAAQFRSMLGLAPSPRQPIAPEAAITPPSNVSLAESTLDPVFEPVPN